MKCAMEQRVIQGEMGRKPFEKSYTLKKIRFTKGKDLLLFEKAEGLSRWDPITIEIGNHRNSKEREFWNSGNGQLRWCDWLWVIQSDGQIDDRDLIGRGQSHR